MVLLCSGRDLVKKNFMIDICWAYYFGELRVR